MNSYGSEIFIRQAYFTYLSVKFEDTITHIYHHITDVQIVRAASDLKEYCRLIESHTMLYYLQIRQEVDM